MKKGFTLIELLAVIIILAIILVVAVPRILKAIDGSKVSAFMSNEKLLLKSTQLYVSNNINTLPVNIGDTTEILLSDLVTDGYIKNIKSPFNKNEDCNGYTLITKIEEGIFDYTPHIKCGLEINNNTEDKLVAHYKFDDFQEPTVNLLGNPSGSNISNPIPGNYKPGWDNSLHNDSILVTSWSSGHNGGVSSPTIGYHAKWVYKNTNNTDPAMLFTDENNTYGLGHRWLGISQDMTNFASLGIQANQKLSVSWNQKSTVLGKGANVGFHHQLISTGGYSFESNINNINVSEIDNWRRVDYTTTIGPDWDLTKIQGLYVYGQVGNYGKLWVDDVQVEHKSYSTPFTEGTRTGTVKDYSKNTYSVPLQLSTTPRWVNDSKSGAGSYLFDGTKEISITNFYNPGSSNPVLLGTLPSSTSNYNGNATYTTWIKPTLLDTTPRHIFTDDNFNEGEIQLTNSGISASWSTGNIVIYNTPIQTNKWYQVTMSHEKDDVNNLYKFKLYLDGVLIGNSETLISTSASTYGPDTRLVIGEYWIGNIDDARIYSRVLSSDEIKLLYDTTK